MASPVIGVSACLHDRLEGAPQPVRSNSRFCWWQQVAECTSRSRTRGSATRPIFARGLPESSTVAKVHSRAIPCLTPRPFDDGSGWYVEAQWVDRAPERLGILRFIPRPVTGSRSSRSPTLYFVSWDSCSTPRNLRSDNDGTHKYRTGGDKKNPGGGHRGSGTQSPDGGNDAPAGTPGCGAGFTGGCPAEYKSVSPSVLSRQGTGIAPLFECRGGDDEAAMPEPSAKGLRSWLLHAPRMPAGPAEQFRHSVAGPIEPIDQFGADSLHIRLGANGKDARSASGTADS
jgi:hypothetical protein